jgi:hypothetical protein
MPASIEPILNITVPTVIAVREGLELNSFSDEEAIDRNITPDMVRNTPNKRKHTEKLQAIIAGTNRWSLFLMAARPKYRRTYIGIIFDLNNK